MSASKPSYQELEEQIRKLRESMQQLQAKSEMLDIAPNSITIHDKKGNFLYANQKTFEMHGMDPEEFMSSGLSKLDSPESRKLFPERISEIEEKGCATFEVIHFKKDRTQFPMEVFAKKIVWQDTPAILSIATDISGRKTLTDALTKVKERAEANEKYYRSLFENTPILLWEEDFSQIKKELDKLIADGNIDLEEYFRLNPEKVAEFASKIKVTNINQTVRTTLNYDNKEALLANLPKLFTEKSLSDFKNALINLSKGNDLFETVTEQRTSDGKIKHLYMKSFAPPDAKNGFEKVFVAMIDVSDMVKYERQLIKAKEKAEESERLKTAFLNNLSHEIRTPMNAIWGFSALLGSAQISKTQQNEYISVIQNSSKQLLDLVDDILTASSLETNQEKVKHSKINVNEILRRLSSLYAREAENRQLTIDYALGLEDVNATIISDKSKLSQILSTLISNALKFTNKGSVQFGYTALKKPGEVHPYELEFYVKDTGIGIKAEELNKIFKHFRQADQIYKQTYRGTGLGLAIAKGFTQLLGGKIWAESQVGKGSVFYFTIPYTKA